MLKHLIGEVGKQSIICFLTFSVTLLLKIIAVGSCQDYSKSNVGRRPSVRPSTKSFSHFDLIWCVGRPRPDMRISMTSTRFKVTIKVTGLLNFPKLHFSKSISFAILTWRSKLVASYDKMEPTLQLIGARFLNFIISKGLQTSRNVHITGLSNGHISLLLETRVTWSGMLVAW